MSRHNGEEGVPPGTWDSKPGDTFALDADVTLYWPVVRPCWEERPTPPEAYQQGYDDGVEQEQARIAKELGRLNDGERLSYVRGFVDAYHLTRPIPSDDCPDLWPNGEHLDPPTDCCTCTTPPAGGDA